MAKKKKRKAKPAAGFADRLVQRLEAGDPGDLAASAASVGLEPERFAAAFETARELVASGPDPRKLAELPGVFQTAFLKLAERDEDDELIADLFGISDDPEVKKEAKRILHRLRSRGLRVELPETAGGSVLDRAVQVEEKPLPCYLSPVTANGGRMVLLARYARGGVAVHQGEMTDSEGLVQFAGGTIGRNRYRQMQQEMTSDPAEQLLQIDYAEARWHLAQAVERCRQAGKAPPGEYLEASGELGEVDEGAAPPAAADRFPADALEDRAALAERAAELLELPEFADWLPDAETIEALEEKLKEVETSQLTINEQQRIDQVQRILDAAAGMLLGDEDRRRRYHQRLLENALYLDRNGRPEEARLAAAAAWQLLDEGFEPADSRFFEKMAKRLFRPAEEIVANMPPPGQSPGPQGSEPSSGNLIVPP